LQQHDMAALTTIEELARISPGDDLSLLKEAMGRLDFETANALLTGYAKEE